MDSKQLDMEAEHLPADSLPSYGTLTLSDHATAMQKENAALKMQLQAQDGAIKKLHQEQQQTHASLQRNIAFCQELEHAVVATNCTSYDGDYLWRIPDVGARLVQAHAGEIRSIYSTPFSTQKQGYQFVLRAFLNGDGEGQGTHLSLYVGLVKGYFDPVLSWPLQKMITISILNQTRDTCIARTFAADGGNNDVFKKPTSTPNPPYGYQTFCKLALLETEQAGYVKDDQMFLRCHITNPTPKNHKKWFTCAKGVKGGVEKKWYKK